MNQALKKEEIRARLLLRRKALPEEERRRGSQEISERLLGLPEFKTARSVHFYLAMVDEVQTEGMIEAALRFRKRVVVPVIYPKKGSLALSELASLRSETLQAGPFGIRQPRPGFQKEVALEEVDLWILPGVAFDERGGRLGFGAGYYDRLLYRAQGTRIGLAFDFQMMDRLPVDHTDRPVDMIITEKRTVCCKESGGGETD